MPNNGRIVEWSDLEYRLAGSCSGSGSGGVVSYGYYATAFTAYAFNVVVVNPGIVLEATSFFDGTSGTWQVRYDGPGAPFGGYIVGGSTYRATEVIARFKNLKIYSKLSGALYRIVWDSIELYVNGAFEIALPSSGGDLTSTGVGPNYIPILGVPMRLDGSVTGGVDTRWTRDPCNPSDVAGGTWESDVPGTISGGWRFKELGSETWEDLPVYVDIRTVPGSGCPFGLNLNGIVSAADTDSAELNLLAKASADLAYLGRVTGSGYTEVLCFDIEGEQIASALIPMTAPCVNECGGGAVEPYRDDYETTSKSEAKSGSIILQPNLEKVIRKLGGPDYKAEIYREDFPEVLGSGIRTCTVDAVTTTSDAQPQMYPGSLPFDGAVGPAAHPMEDFLALPTIAPLWVSASKSETVSISSFGPLSCTILGPNSTEAQAVCPTAFRRATSFVLVIDPAPEGSFKEETLSWTSIASVATVSNYQAHSSTILRYLGSWGNPIWHYFHSKYNWSDIDFLDYWGPSRQQYFDRSWLPPEEKTLTRTDIIGSCFDDSGYTPFMDDPDVGFGHRWLGISRPRLYTPTIPAECQTGEDSVWHFGVYDPETSTWDGAGSVGSTVTIGTATTKATLDVLSFDNYPFMYSLICDRIQIPASGFTNVASFSVKLIGIDGSEVELCTVSGTHVIPKGPNTKYAGSWGIQNSPIPGTIDDLGVDVDANGLSDELMGDALHCSAFSLLPARSYYRLRYDIVKTNPALSATVPHPIFKKNPNPPAMYWESGHIQTLLWPNGSALRLGNWTFYVESLGLLNPPALSGSLKTTIIDALCTIRLIFEARAHDDGLTTELTTLFDSEEGQSVAVVDKFSVAWINPLAGDHTTSTTYQWSLVNTMAETPPLTCFPNKSLVIGSGSWSQTGAYKHEVWDWTQEPRYLIHPTNPMHQKNADATAQITTSVAGVPGWAVTRHLHPVDNTETPTWDIVVKGTKYADATPWRGWFGICDIEVDGVAVWAHNLLSVFGFVHWVWATDSGVKHRRSDTSWPVVTDLSSVISADGSDACPVLRQNADGRLFCVFVRGVKGSRDLLECFSDNDGRTWTTPAVIGMAEYCYTFTDGFGYEGRAKFVFDTGDSGPGTISVQVRGPGETAFGSWVTAAVGGSPVLFAEGSFGIVAAEDSAGHWILTAIEDGDSEPTNYASTDEAKTWKLA